MSENARIDLSRLVSERGEHGINGTSRSAPFDRWFRYPAGFSTELVEALFDLLKPAPGSWLVDPFAGSAVVGTAARRIGVRFCGIEVHPLIADLARLKLAPAPGSGFTVALARIEKDVIRRREIMDATRLIRDEHEFVRRCFDSETLSVLVLIRRAIAWPSLQLYEPWFKWALLGTLRDVANVKVGWPYQLPGRSRKPTYSNVLNRFVARATAIQTDLAGLTERTCLDHLIIEGDARESSTWDQVPRAGLCITSPPYLNNFDYADATKLEMYFLGLADGWSAMNELVRDHLLTAATHQTRFAKAAKARAELQDHPIWPRISEAIAKLEAEKRTRGRGKEYDRLVPMYFAEMIRVIGNLYQALVPGSMAVLIVGDSAPYGVHVDTPALLTCIAEDTGFVQREDVVLRKRNTRWSTNSMLHQVPLTERAVVWARA